jgi:hypothetical protein
MGIPTMSPFELTIRKITMLAFVASMVHFTLAVILSRGLHGRAGLIERKAMALDVGQGCASLLLRIMPFMPFMQIHVQSDAVDSNEEQDPSIYGFVSTLSCWIHSCC